MHCDKDDGCDEEKTASGVVCTRLKERWPTRMTPMVTGKEGIDTYFQVNPASPMSTTRFSSHKAASSGVICRNPEDEMSNLYDQVAGVYEEFGQ